MASKIKQTLHCPNCAQKNKFARSYVQDEGVYINWIGSNRALQSQIYQPIKNKHKCVCSCCKCYTENFEKRGHRLIINPEETKAEKLKPQRDRTILNTTVNGALKNGARKLIANSVDRRTGSRSISLNMGVQRRSSVQRGQVPAIPQVPNSGLNNLNRGNYCITQNIYQIDGLQPITVNFINNSNYGLSMNQAIINVNQGSDVTNNILTDLQNDMKMLVAQGKERKKENKHFESCLENIIDNQQILEIDLQEVIIDQQEIKENLYMIEDITQVAMLEQLEIKENQQRFERDLQQVVQDNQRLQNNFQEVNSYQRQLIYDFEDNKRDLLETKQQVQQDYQQLNQAQQQISKAVQGFKEYQFQQASEKLGFRKFEHKIDNDFKMLEERIKQLEDKESESLNSRSLNNNIQATQEQQPLIPQGAISSLIKIHQNQQIIERQTLEEVQFDHQQSPLHEIMLNQLNLDQISESSQEVIKPSTQPEIKVQSNQLNMSDQQEHSSLDRDSFPKDGSDQDVLFKIAGQSVNSRQNNIPFNKALNSRTIDCKVLQNMQEEQKVDQWDM